jgi:cysteine desulfurase/selenocysteine lyase
MGIGVLYGKKHLLEMMPPYQYGGEMIESVAIEHTTFNELPYKFEAGTPNVEGIVGLGEAIRFMNSNNWMFGYEDELMRYAVEKLSALDFIEIYGQRKDVSILPYSPQHDVRKGVISFNIKGQHHYDVGTLLNQLNIAVRTGHHCAEPLMHALNIEGTIRASFAVYNNTDDVDKLIAGLQQVHTMLVSS